MLRISRTSTKTEGITLLRLEGEIRGVWVEELRRECGRASGGHARLVLDLGGVSSIDAAGLALFRELRDQQVAVTNCSPYIGALLECVSHVEG